MKKLAVCYGQNRQPKTEKLFIFAFNKKIGFSNPEEFQTFIENNRLTKEDSINNDLTKDIIAEINLLSIKKNKLESESMSIDEQFEFGLITLIVTFIILFGLRYLFYAITWSFKTLKEKSE